MRGLPRTASLVLGVAVVLAVGVSVRSFVIGLFHVPSESMAPTLIPGDWIIVEKLRFGPSVPLTDWRLGNPKLPELNDIVLLASDRIVVPQPGYGGVLVKRVVARPGDTLYMRRGVLFLNGSNAIFQRVRTGHRYSDIATPVLDWMRLRSLSATRFGAAPAALTFDNWGPLVVPKDSIFVLGDNLRRSMDSRQFGFVPSSAVVGAVRYVYFSVHRDAGNNWPQFMLNRIGRVK